MSEDNTVNDDQFGVGYEGIRAACLHDPDKLLKHLFPSKFVKQSEREYRVGVLLALAIKFANEPGVKLKQSAARLVALADGLVAHSKNPQNVKLREEVDKAIDYVFDRRRMPLNNPLTSIDVAFETHRELEDDRPYAEKLRTIVAMQLSKLEESCVIVTRNFCDYPTHAGNVISTYAKVLNDYLAEPEPFSPMWRVFSDSYVRGGLTLEKNGYFDTAQRIDHHLAVNLPPSWSLTRLAADNFSRHMDAWIDGLIKHPDETEHRMNWQTTSNHMTAIRRQLEGTYPYFINMFETIDRRFQEAEAKHAERAPWFYVERSDLSGGYHSRPAVAPHVN